MQGEEFVTGIPCLLIAFKQRIDNDEPQVVVIDGPANDGRDSLGIAHGRLHNRLAARIFIIHPQDARPEAGTPFLGLGFPTVPRLLPIQNVSRHHREIIRS